mgnify:CR=1 FL=1
MIIDYNLVDAALQKQQQQSQSTSLLQVDERTNKAGGRLRAERKARTARTRANVLNPQVAAESSIDSILDRGFAQQADVDPFAADQPAIGEPRKQQQQQQTFKRLDTDAPTVPSRFVSSQSHANARSGSHSDRPAVAVVSASQLQLLANTLWVLEQVPGPDGIIARDLTPTLNTARYWASYNRPFFPEIVALSDYARFAERHGTRALSYEDCQRARIFAREQPRVTDLASLQRLMMLNEFATDPISNGCPGEAIAARFDLPQSAAVAAANGAVSSFLQQRAHSAVSPTAAATAVSTSLAIGPAQATAELETRTHAEVQAQAQTRVGRRGRAFKTSVHEQCEVGTRANGAIDSKVTKAAWIRDRRSLAISSPTHDEQPVFVWSTSDFAAEKPALLPDAWNFEWQDMQPRHDLAQ